MRKIILIGLVLLNVILIESCKKENLNTNDKSLYSESEYYNDLSLKVENFLNESLKNEGTYNINQRRRKWSKILKEDIKGALTGGAAGATIGGAVGAGAGGAPSVPGAIIGAVIGGVLLGGASSVDAAINGDEPINRVPLNPTLNICYNNNNPYENVGINHNSIFNYCLNNFTLIPSTSSQINFNNYYEDVKSFVNTDSLSNIIINNNTFRITLSEFFYNQDYRSQNLIECLESLYQRGDINLIEKNLLRPYLNFINAISNNVNLSNSTFQNISCQLENMIIFSNLQVKSKVKILTVINTGKYSYGISEQFTD